MSGNHAIRCAKTYAVAWTNEDADAPAVAQWSEAAGRPLHESILHLVTLCTQGLVLRDPARVGGRIHAD